MSLFDTFFLSAGTSLRTICYAVYLLSRGAIALKKAHLAKCNSTTKQAKTDMYENKKKKY